MGNSNQRRQPKRFPKSLPPMVPAATPAAVAERESDHEQTERLLACEELQLKIDELKLRIKLQTKPWVQPTFWFSVVACVVAVLGVVAQGTLSTIKSETAKLDVAKAEIQKADALRKQGEAEAKVHEASAAEERAEHAREIAIKAQGLVWQRLNDARPALDAMQSKLADLIQARDVSNGDVNTRLKELNELLGSARRHLYFLNLSFRPETPHGVSPPTSVATIGGDERVESIYVMDEARWRELSEMDGLAALWNEKKVEPYALKYGKVPLQIKLQEGSRYAVVIRTANLLLVEMIEVPTREANVR